MNLTNKKLREFFPRDNRFIHYCSKRYGYTFFNDDAVNDSRYYASINLIRYIDKNGNQFDDEKHLVATVMSCIRYGILSAVKPSKPKKRVDILLESDLMYASGDSEGYVYNKYEANCFSMDDEYGGYETLLQDLRDSIDVPIEKLFLEECMLMGRTAIDVSKENDVSERELNLAKLRVRTKFKNIIKEEDERIERSVKIRNRDQGKLQSTDKGLSNEDWNRRIAKNEDSERSYSEAMSFLYS